MEGIKLYFGRSAVQIRPFIGCKVIEIQPNPGLYTCADEGDLSLSYVIVTQRGSKKQGLIHEISTHNLPIYNIDYATGLIMRRIKLSELPTDKIFFINNVLFRTGSIVGVHREIFLNDTKLLLHNSTFVKIQDDNLTFQDLVPGDLFKVGNDSVIWKKVKEDDVNGKIYNAISSHSSTYFVPLDTKITRLSYKVKLQRRSN